MPFHNKFLASADPKRRKKEEKDTVPYLTICLLTPPGPSTSFPLPGYHPGRKRREIAQTGPVHPSVA